MRKKSYNFKNLISFYDKNVKEFKNDSIRSVAWGSRKSQEKRFEVLSQIADLKGKSVLDVGCGFGDFYDWLKRKYGAISYTGFDITPSMVEMAFKRHPDADFNVQNILELNKNFKSYDYVFASGIFNRKISKHEAFITDTINKMFDLCRKGIAFNIMSIRADFMEREEYYADPGKLINICLSLSSKVILRHDYMPHDFTVCIYK